MRALSSLGSRQLAHRKGRSVLTALGIVLGVAILFGVLVSNATTQSGVDRLIRDFTGAADVIVRPAGVFDATLPESVVGKLAALPDVRLAVGSFRFESGTRVDTEDEPRQVTVRGIELASARALQEYVLTAGRFFRPDAREAVVPERLAREASLRLGGAVEVATPSGLARLDIVGILTDTGAGRTDQGSVVFTSIGTARALAGVGRVVSGARLMLEPGTDVEQWIERNERAAGTGLQFENAEELASGFQDFLAILGAVFTFFAAITLFVGSFLIYLTLSMAVIERTRIYGTMRALGATRAQVRRVVLAEAVVLGAISTVLGLALGLLIARGLLMLLASLFEIDLPGLTVTPGAIVAGITVGIVTTLVSSLIPARRAARLSPVVAMRGDYAAETRLGRAWIAGAVSLGAGLVVAVVAGRSAGSASTPLILLGAVLLTPLVLRPLARVLGKVTNRVARGVGDVAVLHLVKERSRSAYTLALIMVVMGMIFSVGGLNVTLKRSMFETLDRQFGSDILVHPPGQQTVGTLGPEFERELRALPGVGEYTALRFGFLKVERPGEDDQDVFARIIDPSTYFSVAGFAFVEGNDREAREALAAGGAVLIARDQAKQLKVSLGDSIRLVTSAGARAFRVAGTFSAFAGPPEIVLGLSDGRRYLNAGDASVYLINAREGTSAAALTERIEDRLAAQFNVVVETPSDIKQDAERQFGQFFNVFYAILFVAAIVGLLGLANTLAMSVVQRYREIGVLRAIGATRSQVRRMVFVESATLGLVAFVLSVPLGLLLSLITVRGIEGAFGFDVAYVYPASWVPLVILFGGAVAVLAAIAPGRRAARLDVVNALQFE